MRFLTTLIIAALLAGTALAADPEPKVKASNVQFDALKTLAGKWTGTPHEGKKSVETYRIVSGDSAIILDQQTPDGGNMITMFHPDGQKTVATHYCSMGNQPRMVAEGANTKEIAFRFKDITNDDGKSGSMRDLTIVLVDKDHHNQVWTWQDAKGKQQVETFKYTRSTSSAQGQ